MKELILWMALAQAGDLATTGIGLHRGCVEVAPLYRSMPYPAILGVKGGATVTLSFTLGRAPATKAAKALVIGLAASGTVATALNLRTLPNCR